MVGIEEQIIVGVITGVISGVIVKVIMKKPLIFALGVAVALFIISLCFTVNL